MNNSRRILLVFTACLFTLPILAQDSKDHKIKVYIETEENGTKQVFERTYSNKEEMLEDEEFKERHDADEDLQELVLTNPAEDQSKEVEIDVISEGEADKIRVHKVIKGKDGEAKVIKKEYHSKEEMEADKDLDLRIDSGTNDFKKSNDEVVEIEVIRKSGKDQKIGKTIIIEMEEGDGVKKIKKETQEIEKEQNR